jgi:hypothetical protein
MHCLARLGPTQSKILMRSVPDGCAGFNVVIGNDKSKSFWSCRGLALRQAMFQAMSQGYSKLGILIRLFIRRRQPYGLRVHLIDTAMYI